MNASPPSAKYLQLPRGMMILIIMAAALYALKLLSRQLFGGYRPGWRTTGRAVISTGADHTLNPA